MVQSWEWEYPLEKKGQPPPVFLPGKSCGEMSQVGYSRGAHKDSNMTERPNTTRSQKDLLEGQVLGAGELQIKGVADFKKCITWEL